MEDKIVIYMKHGCPYCEKVKNYMKDKKNIVMYYVGEDFKLKDYKDKYGQDATFPRGYHQKKDGSVVLIGDSNRIVGYL